MSEVTVGRKKEQSEIETHIKNGCGCVVLAPAGSGKTHLLKKIAKKYHKKSVYIEYSNSVREAQLTIIRHLDPKLREKAKQEKVIIDRVHVPYRTLKDQRYWIKDLLEDKRCEEGRDPRGRKRTKKREKFVMIFDHFEKVTPTMRPLFDFLKDRVIFVFGCTEIKKKEKYLGRVWWGLPRVYLSNLSETESAELLWRLVNRNQIEDSVRVEKQVLKIAKGRPLAIEKMAEKIRSGMPLWSIQDEAYEGTQKTFGVTLFVVCLALFGVFFYTREMIVGVAAGGVGIFAVRQFYMQARRDSSLEEAEDLF